MIEDIVGWLRWAVKGDGYVKRVVLKKAIKAKTILRCEIGGQRKRIRVKSQNGLGYGLRGQIGELFKDNLLVVVVNYGLQGARMTVLF